MKILGYNMFNKIKHFIQRGRRGFSDEDVWDFGSYLAEIVPPAVRQLKKGHGCPSEFYNKERLNDECHLWHDILEEIAQGFEAVLALNNFNYFRTEKTDDGHYKQEIDQERYDALNKKAERGLELFAKWFQSLWD